MAFFAAEVRLFFCFNTPRGLLFAHFVMTPSQRKQVSPFNANSRAKKLSFVLHATEGKGANKRTQCKGSSFHVTPYWSRQAKKARPCNGT